MVFVLIYWFIIVDYWLIWVRFCGESVLGSMVLISLGIPVVMDLEIDFGCFLSVV